MCLDAESLLVCCLFVERWFAPQRSQFLWETNGYVTSISQSIMSSFVKQPVMRWEQLFITDYWHRKSGDCLCKELFQVHCGSVEDTSDIHAHCSFLDQMRLQSYTSKSTEVEVPFPLVTPSKNWYGFTIGLRSVSDWKVNRPTRATVPTSAFLCRGRRRRIVSLVLILSCWIIQRSSNPSRAVGTVSYKLRSPMNLSFRAVCSLL